MGEPRGRRRYILNCDSFWSESTKPLYIKVGKYKMAKGSKIK